MNRLKPLEGSCHCGNIHYQLHLTKALKSYTARACQCSFCRKHSGTYISDPKGKLLISIKDRKQANHYRFASKVIEFLICKSCGVLPCAIRTIDDKQHGIVNIHTLKSNIASTLEVQPLDYDEESEADKKHRHNQNWIADVTLTTER